MSQEFVAMYRSRWTSDDDWRSLTPLAQWTFDMLLQHPDRNAAGVLSLTPRKWTKVARGLTVADLRRGMTELDDAGFIVVDDDTEEILVRSFIRRATVYKHIRLLAKALKAIPDVESERLRSALGYELMRIPPLDIPRPNGRNDVAIAEAEHAQQRLNELASMLCDAPPDPPGQGAAHPMAHPMAQGMETETGHPLPHPPGVGAGTGAGVGTGTAVGSCLSSENESLESNAREKRRLAAVPDPWSTPSEKDAS